jgi:flavodoxin
MKITIVYESMFGNTHEVAQAISDRIRQMYDALPPDALPGSLLLGPQ